LKTRKILINQGFSIKNKHRFYDTVSYHNYGAYLVRIKGLELIKNAAVYFALFFCDCGAALEFVLRTNA
jgi:hypothetical protein